MINMLKKTLEEMYTIKNKNINKKFQQRIAIHKTMKQMVQKCKITYLELRSLFGWV